MPPVRRKKLEPDKPPTPDDVWRQKRMESCARAGAVWLKGSVNLQRPIKSLTLLELTNLAQNITDRWIVVTSYRMATAPESVEAIEGQSVLG